MDRAQRRQLAMTRCVVNLALGGSGLAAVIVLLRQLNEMLKEREQGR